MKSVYSWFAVSFAVSAALVFLAISIYLSTVAQQHIETINRLKQEVSTWETKCQSITKLPNENLTGFITTFIKDNQPKISTDVANLISKSVVKNSASYNLPPGLLIGIIDAESKYNPMARSKAKARGLMQIMFKVWGKALNIKNFKELYEIDLNINYGSRILKVLLKQEGTLSKALSKYLGTTSSGKYRDQILNTFAKFELDKYQYMNSKSKEDVKKE